MLQVCGAVRFVCRADVNMLGLCWGLSDRFGPGLAAFAWHLSPCQLVLLGTRFLPIQVEAWRQESLGQSWNRVPEMNFVLMLSIGSNILQVRIALQTQIQSRLARQDGEWMVYSARLVAKHTGIDSVKDMFRNPVLNGTHCHWSNQNRPESIPNQRARYVCTANYRHQLCH